MALATRLSAQTNTGNLYGRVFDELGSPIPGATATLTGPAGPRMAGTDATGAFRFPRVAPARYTLTVTAPGLKTVTRENVLVSVGQNLQVDIPLTLAAMEEDVTVTNAAPLLDTRRVATGQTFTNEELTRIPTARDIWALAQQIPGVQLDTVNVAGNASAITGGPSLTSKGSGNVVYQVDGATVTDNTYGNPFARQNGGTSTFFDFSTFDNVEIATGGSMLEQQTSGVTINVVTKRGTNQLRGSARFLYASASWQSTNTPQEATDAGLVTNSTRYIREYGGELGGPIIPDRLWIWAAGSRQDISLNPVRSADDPLYDPTTAILEPWSAKLNGQISAANAAAFYFQRSNRIENGVNVFVGTSPDIRTDFLIPTGLYKAEDSNVFSSDSFASMFASYLSEILSETPSRGIGFGDPAYDAQYYDFSFHNNWYYYYEKTPQREANLQVSKFFNTGRLNHELKFTFNYHQQIADSTSGLPGDQLLGSEFSSSASAAITRGVRRIYEAQYWTGTIGDTLTAGNLTIQAGIRYDLQQVKNLPGTSFGNTVFPELLPEVKYHGAKDWQFQFTNWQPRVSATYALGETKGTLLRASYGRFVDQLGALGFYGNGVPGMNGYYASWTDLNGDHTVQRNEVVLDDPPVYRTFDPAVLPSVPNNIQPGFRTTATNEFTAGADHQFTDTLAVSGTFSYRTTDNLQQGIPIGSSLSTYALAGQARGTATAANGFTIHFDEPFYSLTLAEPPTGQELTNRPGATQRYYGVDVSIIKRLSDNWMMRGNVGWSSFKQYLGPGSIQNPNNLWYLGGQNDNGGLATGYSSRLDADSVFINGSWQFNINGAYQGPWGLSFAANFFGRQGYPNPYAVRVYTQDVNYVEDILIQKVDTYRYPNVYELDLRLQKAIPIGPVIVTPIAELFNAANSNTVLQRWQRVGDFREGQYEPDPYFNEILGVQSPRIVRLALQVSF